jgi:pyruvate dehydrogenase E2 component (dihydrolipoamide acetyltransferase)
MELKDLQGGTFTITSLGAQGGLLATPIIYHPQVAILGVHEIKRRPVVDEGGNVVVRDIMNLSCTFDHRLIDGHVGASFLKGVAHYLTHPALLLLHGG